MAPTTPPVRGSPTNFLNGLVRSFQDKSIQFDSKTNLKMKMESYVEVIEVSKQEQQETSCPDVKYRKKSRGCTACVCHFICKKIFSNWSCCQRAVCCTSETVYNIKVGEDDNSVHLTPGRVQNQVQNQLTNATFLLELYNTYGSEYLPITYVCAIDCIERFFPLQVEYWRNWDPSSQEPLEKSKAKFFRELMEDAYVVLRNARLELMKQDLQDNLDKVAAAASHPQRSLFTPPTPPPAITITVQSSSDLKESIPPQTQIQKAPSLTLLKLSPPKIGGSPLERSQSNPPAASPLSKITAQSGVDSSQIQSPHSEENIPDAIQRATGIIPLKLSPPKEVGGSPLERSQSHPTVSPLSKIAAQSSSGSSQMKSAHSEENISEAIQRAGGVTIPVVEVLGLPSRQISASGSPGKGSSDEDTVMLAVPPAITTPLTPQGAVLRAFDMTQKSSPSTIVKGVCIGNTIVEFDSKKIVDDLLLMTQCTEEEAKTVANKVEEKLEFPCHRKNIWEAIKAEIRNQDIKIKATIDPELVEAVLTMMESGECLRFVDIPLDKIPVTKFTNLIIRAKQKQTKTSAADDKRPSRGSARAKMSFKTAALAVTAFRPTPSGGSSNLKPQMLPILISMREQEDAAIANGLAALSIKKESDV